MNRDNFRVTPLTTDTTTLNYNSIFNEKTFNNIQQNILNSTFIKTEENLSGNTNLEQKKSKKHQILQMKK